MRRRGRRDRGSAGGSIRGRPRGQGPGGRGVRRTERQSQPPPPPGRWWRWRRRRRRLDGRATAEEQQQQQCRRPRRRRRQLACVGLGRGCRVFFIGFFFFSFYFSLRRRPRVRRSLRRERRRSALGGAPRAGRPFLFSFFFFFCRRRRRRRHGHRRGSCQARAEAPRRVRTGGLEGREKAKKRRKNNNKKKFSFSNACARPRVVGGGRRSQRRESRRRGVGVGRGAPAQAAFRGELVDAVGEMALMNSLFLLLRKEKIKRQCKEKTNGIVFYKKKEKEGENEKINKKCFQ